MPILTALMGLSLLTGTVPVPSAIVDAPVSSFTVAMTAYNAVPAQTDSNPFETASGAYSNPETVAARSRDLADKLPFGTIIEITGPAADPNGTCGYDAVRRLIGYRIIEDTMNAKFVNRIDVLLPTSVSYQTADGKRNAANVLGICDGVSVRVVGHVDINHLPKTQAELASLVTGTHLAVK